MFFKALAKKHVIILIILSIPIFFFSQDKSYFGMVSHITAEIDSPPLSYMNNVPTELAAGMNIESGATILTTENQKVELVIMHDGTTDGHIIIDENTDFKFEYDPKTTLLHITVIYGSIRAVIKEGAPVMINAEGIKSELYGVDLGFFSGLGAQDIRNGYLILFGGESLVAPRSATKNFTVIKALQVVDYQGEKISEPRKISIEDFSAWKENMLIQSTNVSSSLPIVLENLDLKPKDETKEINETDEPDETDETDDATEIVTSIIDETADTEKKKKIDYRNILRAFLAFEAGNTSYSNMIGVTFSYLPGTTFLDNKLEFYLDLSATIIPSKIFTDDLMIKTNKNNNEWSFGSDWSGNTNGIVFDVFDDLLLKLGYFRFNQKTDKVFIEAGRDFAISDYLNYSLENFNSYMFYPRYKNTSFLTDISLNWFNFIFFAENIVPRGIYFTELQFMTPYESFRFRFKLSGIIDCYDLITFDNSESFFPVQSNIMFSFDAFNVPSFGFSLFLGGGIYIPTTYDFTDKSSLFTDLTNQNALAIIGNTSMNVGFKARLKAFNFTLQFIYDSGLNEIGLFDVAYIATREAQKAKITSWMNDLTNRELTINDFNFGFRAGVFFDIKSIVDLELYYRLTFPQYKDKLNFKLNINVNNKKDLHVKLYILWQLHQMIFAIQDIKTFQNNNIAFIGAQISPIRGIEIDFSAGIYPDLITYSDPLYSQFILNFNIAVKPFMNEKMMPKIEVKPKEEKTISIPDKISTPENKKKWAPKKREPVKRKPWKWKKKNPKDSSDEESESSEEKTTIDEEETP